VSSEEKEVPSLPTETLGTPAARDADQVRQKSGWEYPLPPNEALKFCACNPCMVSACKSLRHFVVTSS